MSFRQARSALSEEFAAIRSREPDLDAGHITVFSIPLVLGLVGVLAIGVVPLIVVPAAPTPTQCWSRWRDRSH